MKTTDNSAWVPYRAGALPLPCTSSSETEVTPAPTWTEVNASVGALRVRELNLYSSQGKAGILLDAALGRQRLELSPSRLKISTALDGKFTTTLSAHGLGTDFNRGPLRTAANFVNETTQPLNAPLQKRATPRISPTPTRHAAGDYPKPGTFVMISLFLEARAQSTEGLGPLSSSHPVSARGSGPTDAYPRPRKAIGPMLVSRQALVSS